MNGNNALSDTARAATKRILALRIAAQKTGLATFEEQARVLLTLNDDDMLAVADFLSKERRAERHAERERQADAVKAVRDAF